MSAQRAPGTAGSGTGDSGTYELYGDTLVRLDGGGGGSTTGDFISLGLNDITNSYGGGSYADANQGGMLTQQSVYGINPGTGREFTEAHLDKYAAVNDQWTDDRYISPEEWAAYQLSFGVNDPRWTQGWAADTANQQKLYDQLAYGAQSLSGAERQAIEGLMGSIYGDMSYMDSFGLGALTPTSTGSTGSTGTVTDSTGSIGSVLPGYSPSPTPDAGSGLVGDVINSGNWGSGSYTDDDWYSVFDEYFLSGGTGPHGGADELIDAGLIADLNRFLETLEVSGVDPADMGSILDGGISFAKNRLYENLINGTVLPSQVGPDALESLGISQEEWTQSLIELGLADGGSATQDPTTPSDDGNVTQDPTTPEYPAEWESVINDLISGNNNITSIQEAIDHIEYVNTNHPDADLDGNGVVTDEEWSDYMNPEPEGPQYPAEWGGVIDDLIASDNNINTVEDALAHIEYVNTNFPDADTNSDGVVSDQEWADYNDLAGDPDLEQGGPLWDAPQPITPTGEWQWDPEMQDYEWVEGVNDPLPILSGTGEYQWNTDTEQWDWVDNGGLIEIGDLGLPENADILKQLQEALGGLTDQLGDLPDAVVDIIKGAIPSADDLLDPTPPGTIIGIQVTGVEGADHFLKDLILAIPGIPGDPAKIRLTDGNGDWLPVFDDPDGGPTIAGNIIEAATKPLNDVKDAVLGAAEEIGEIWASGDTGIIEKIGSILGAPWEILTGILGPEDASNWLKDFIIGEIKSGLLPDYGDELEQPGGSETEGGEAEGSETEGGETEDGQVSDGSSDNSDPLPGEGEEVEDDGSDDSSQDTDSGIAHGQDTFPGQGETDQETSDQEASDQETSDQGGIAHGQDTFPDQGETDQEANDQESSNQDNTQDDQSGIAHGQDTFPGQGSTEDTTEQEETPEETPEGDPDPDPDPDPEEDPVIVEPDPDPDPEEDPIVDGGGAGGAGGGGAGRQGGMFTGGIGVDYSPLQSVIYRVGDPMADLERMISKSLFKDMM